MRRLQLDVANARELCIADEILVVKGRVDHKEGETKLIALDVAAFEAIPERRTFACGSTRVRRAPA